MCLRDVLEDRIASSCLTCWGIKWRWPSCQGSHLIKTVTSLHDTPEIRLLCYFSLASMVFFVMVMSDNISVLLALLGVKLVLQDLFNKRSSNQIIGNSNIYKTKHHLQLVSAQLLLCVWGIKGYLLRAVVMECKV